jgi:ribosomal protein L1
MIPKIVPTYTPEQAIALLNEQYRSYMDGSAQITNERRKRLNLSRQMPYHINVNLNIDPKKGKGHKMNTMFELLHGSPLPTQTVVAFCPPEYIEEAKAAGATYAGGKDEVVMPLLNCEIKTTEVDRFVTLSKFWNSHESDKQKKWFRPLGNFLQHHELMPCRERWTIVEDDHDENCTATKSSSSKRSPKTGIVDLPPWTSRSWKDRFMECVNKHAHARWTPCRTNASGHVVTTLGRIHTHSPEQIIENLMQSVLPRLYQLQPSDFGEIGRKKKRARRFHYVINIYIGMTGIGAVALDLKHLLGDSGIDPTYANFTQEIIYRK